jgi:hypothetical protein
VGHGAGRGPEFQRGFSSLLSGSGRYTRPPTPDRGVMRGVGLQQGGNLSCRLLAPSRNQFTGSSRGRFLVSDYVSEHCELWCAILGLNQSNQLASGKSSRGLATGPLYRASPTSRALIPSPRKPIRGLHVSPPLWAFGVAAARLWSRRDNSPRVLGGGVGGKCSCPFGLFGVFAYDFGLPPVRGLSHATH